MYLDTKAEYTGDNELSETQLEMKKVYDVIKGYHKITKISTYGTDRIIIDFKDNFSEWGHFSELPATGWYVEAFSNNRGGYDGIDEHSKMWLAQFP